MRRSTPRPNPFPSRAAGPTLGGMLVLLALGGCDGAASGPQGGGGPGLFDDQAGFAGVAGEPRESASSGFWDHWGDGTGELSSYRITLPRYGQEREGELVLVYVTEPHDRRTWIKDDRAEEPDRVEVLKLNASLEFLTGIYPYSVMTSVFAPVDAWHEERFQPTKIRLSVQEWCGNYMQQVWPGTGAMRSLLVSYFPSDGEELREVDVPTGTLYEDGLWIQLRELDGSFAGGGDWEGMLVPSLWNVRRGIAPAEPVPASITRSSVDGAEGAALTRFTLRYGAYESRFDVEEAYPRRIVSWTSSEGDTARIVETRRLPYWELNDGEGGRHREELGLSPRASGIPPGSGS